MHPGYSAVSNGTACCMSYIQAHRLNLFVYCVPRGGRQGRGVDKLVAARTKSNWCAMLYMYGFFLILPVRFTRLVGEMFFLGGYRFAGHFVSSFCFLPPSSTSDKAIMIGICHRSELTSRFLPFALSFFLSNRF